MQNAQQLIGCNGWRASRDKCACAMALGSVLPVPAVLQFAFETVLKCNSASNLMQVWELNVSVSGPASVTGKLAKEGHRCSFNLVQLHKSATRHASCTASRKQSLPWQCQEDASAVSGAQQRFALSC